MFTVSVRSIDNPLARLAYFIANLKKTCVIHASRVEDCVSLKITEMAIFTGEYASSRHGS